MKYMLWAHIKSALARHFYNEYLQHVFKGEIKKTVLELS